VRILLVEDDASSSLIAQAELRSLGHECHVVTDGALAWDSIRSDRPDVVISDWTMPGLSGLQLCRNVRAYAGGYIYFIMVTSHGSPADVLEGMNAGADDYLVKPLDPDALQARLIAAARVTALHRQSVSQQTELEVLNRELTIIARQDPLTGLRNRRALQEDLDLLEAQTARYGYSCCIALVDIDHFKSYNDANGHLAGDHVIQSVAAQLKEQARGGDALYRYGGDEFLCIFPQQSLASGSVAVQRMRIGVERLVIRQADASLGVVTVSAGVALLDPVHPRPPREVLREADKALYLAKQLGRNRVEYASSEAA
jgi:diguanylate cyclase (GGDEF)-like protein